MEEHKPQNLLAGTILSHSDFGDTECCGCLNAFAQGEWAVIVCNDCGSRVATVLTENLQKMLNDMELSLDLASVMCPRCGSVNLFPGFSKMTTFRCRQCGQPVNLPPTGE